MSDPLRCYQSCQLLVVPVRARLHEGAADPALGSEFSGGATCAWQSSACNTVRWLISSDNELCGEQTRLTKETAPLAEGHTAVTLFVNDDADAPVLEVLAEGGTRVIAMRCAGFDKVDVSAAESLGIKVRNRLHMSL